jgi:hypothetical protein
MIAALLNRLIEALTPPPPPDDMIYCPHCGGTGFDRLWTPCVYCGTTGYVPKHHHDMTVFFKTKEECDSHLKPFEESFYKAGKGWHVAHLEREKFSWEE